MRLILLLLGVMLAVSSAFAQATGPKRILISDIDDTLKDSHILGITGGVARAFLHDPLHGMPALVRAIAPAVSAIFYVSSAPQEIMRQSHEQFLGKNNFPAGSLILSDLNPSNRHNFKLRVIREILRRELPQEVIFLGDNGEIDTLVYSQIRREFEKEKGIGFYTFIHRDYSQKSGGRILADRQISFVTAGEVGMALTFFNIIPWKVTLELIKVSMAKGSLLGLPDWYDCRQHKVVLPDPRMAQAAKPMLDAIVARCKYVVEDEASQ